MGSLAELSFPSIIVTRIETTELIIDSQATKSRVRFWAMPVFTPPRRSGFGTACTVSSVALGSGGYIHPGRTPYASPLVTVIHRLSEVRQRSGSDAPGQVQPPRSSRPSDPGGTPIARKIGKRGSAWVTAATGLRGGMATSRCTSRLPTDPKRGALAECRTPKFNSRLPFRFTPRKKRPSRTELIRLRAAARLSRFPGPSETKVSPLFGPR